MRIGWQTQWSCRTQQDDLCAWVCEHNSHVGLNAIFRFSDIHLKIIERHSQKSGKRKMALEIQKQGKIRFPDVFSAFPTKSAFPTFIDGQDSGDKTRNFYAMEKKRLQSTTTEQDY